MYKCLTLFYLMWMTVSQVVFCQEERFSFLAEGNLIMPIKGSFSNNPEIPEMVKIDNKELGSFFMARTEVTVYQYRQFCKETNRKMPSRMPSWGWRENHPMVYVTLKDAQDYCHWLSDKTGIHYRLPTIKEWELAAGANYQQSGEQKQSIIASVAWYNETQQVLSTNTVATKMPNIYGLYDMQGNVWEWCLSEQSGFKSPIKGGSWNRGENALKITNTEFIPTETKAYNIGFRLVAFVK